MRYDIAQNVIASKVSAVKSWDGSILWRGPNLHLPVRQSSTAAAHGTDRSHFVTSWLMTSTMSSNMLRVFMVLNAGIKIRSEGKDY